MAVKKKGTRNFKTCDCGKSWKTRDELVRDRSVKIVGYQPDFVSRKFNHYLFQHTVKSCGAFLAVRASAFDDLREKDCPKEVCAGKEGCPRYCMNTLDLRVCSITCRNANDRALAAKMADRRLLRKLFPSVASGTEGAEKA